MIINGPNGIANHCKINTMSFGKLQFILYQLNVIQSLYFKDSSLEFSI